MKFLKEIRYIIEYILVKIFILIFKILKFEKSTKLSIFLIKLIGKRLSVHNLAKDNIQKSLKKLTKKEVGDIIEDMWENLGRIITEYYFINKKPKEEFDKMHDNEILTQAFAVKGLTVFKKNKKKYII